MNDTLVLPCTRAKAVFGADVAFFSFFSAPLLRCVQDKDCANVRRHRRYSGVFTVFLHTHTTLYECVNYSWSRAKRKPRLPPHLARQPPSLSQSAIDCASNIPCGSQFVLPVKYHLICSYRHLVTVK